MLPKTISLLGVGLLGGSIGLAARTRLKGVRVRGYGHRRSTLDAALELGALDEGHEDVAGCVAGADLVILCTPVGLFESLLRQVSPFLSSEAVVTDVGSTKRNVMKAASTWLPAPERFVGSHPMAGSEKKGVLHARADLYDGALCLITPTARTDPVALAMVETFWQALGMRIARLSPEEHDRRLAAVSHLPHALAAALVAMQEPESVALSGKGFADMTRIAAGDGQLWRDIFVDNRDNVRQSIGQLKLELDRFLKLLDAPDPQALAQWLDDVATRRQDMLEGRPPR